MKTTSLRLLPLLVALSLPLAACKKTAPAADAAGSTPAAVDTASQAPAPAPAAPAPAAAQPTTPDLADGGENPPFDFNTVPEAGGKIAPFPYVDYPPTVHQAFQSTEELPMDRVMVILGDHLHAVEGRVATRSFSPSHAKMSELEIRRNYENAMRELGATKVNTVGPYEEALYGGRGDDYEYKIRRAKLLVPDLRMSYDVYLARKGDARHWIVVMANDSTVRLLAIEEKPFAQTVGYVGANGAATPVTASGTPPTAAQPVDINAIPVTTAALPSFPYLAYPPELNQAFQSTRNSRFDAVGIIVGKELRTVEGQVETRSFSNRHAKMSQMAVRRNYEAAIKGLGGVKVNAVDHRDKALLAANTSKEVSETTLRQDKLRVDDFSMSYDSYLVRTPEKNVWLVLMTGESDTRLLAVEEKAMQQSVSLVTADTMGKELAAKGKIALYVNFDTDKASIRPDGKPTVDEIAKLLKGDPSLKLAIEGHTDDSGNAARNLDLSRQRADSVVQSLVAAGIDARRLRAAGHGATKPLADNKEEAGRAKNRRVELVKI
ncbi:OmpA family protein [Massilia sp. Se16.2.3]|uniref:OmpA family protein n=1 Tax=Massilia sp. Se16.2.3 TaxID=2709303 RepID=UPI0015FF25D2|nr:OmpA family protein [Massilia sp. Se16.2.3]QNA99783.1 OmpA family protein [Massilia sp. Se16.2.3]